MSLPSPFPGVVAVNNAVQTPVVTPPTTFKFKKAGKNGTLITMILDESGSMTSCWDSTIAGFNEFVNGQKTADASAGAGYLSLIKFDAPRISTVYENMPLSEIPQLDKNSYRPNGGTNLLDAIGQAMTSVNSILASKKKNERPGVIIVIMTDGHENSSRNYTNDQIKNMVAAAEKSDWTFTFLGANIDSFAVGSNFGMRAANTVDYSTVNMVSTMSVISESATRMRTAKAAGVSTEALYSSDLYTSHERNKLK